MSAEERAQIDRFVQFDTVPVLQRDQAAERELIAQLDVYRESSMIAG